MKMDPTNSEEPRPWSDALAIIGGAAKAWAAVTIVLASIVGFALSLIYVIYVGTSYLDRQ